MVKKIHLSTSFSSHSMASQWTLRILLHSCSGGPDDWIPIIHRLNVPFRNEIRFAIPCAPLRKESHNLWKGEMNSWFEYGEDGESAEDCVTMDGKWKIHWMEFVLNSLCFVKSVNIVNWVSSSRDNIAMHSICSMDPANHRVTWMQRLFRKWGQVEDTSADFATIHVSLIELELPCPVDFDQNALARGARTHKSWWIRLKGFISWCRKRLLFYQVPLLAQLFVFRVLCLLWMCDVDVQLNQDCTNLSCNPKHKQSRREAVFYSWDMFTNGIHYGEVRSCVIFSGTPLGCHHPPQKYGLIQGSLNCQFLEGSTNANVW